MMTGKRRYMYGLQGTPYCDLCGTDGHGRCVSDTAHILGGCPHECLRGLHCRRHDEAVHMVYQELASGYKGSVRIIRDKGRHEAASAEDRKTMPGYLFPGGIVDARAVKRPDIVVIHRVPGHGVAPAHFVPFEEHEDRRVYLIEISYTGLANMAKRKAEKEAKYKGVMEELRRAGWCPELVVIVLGTLGEVTVETAEAMDRLGVRGAERLEGMLRDLNRSAVEWMDRCIDAEATFHRAAGMARPREGGMRVGRWGVKMCG